MKKPGLGDVLPACHPCNETIELLKARRSTPADFLTEPGPDPETLSSILEIGARVPDHRRVTPFRFVVFEGDARQRFGEVLQAAFVANEPTAEPTRIDYERNRFMRAPVVIAVISSINTSHRTPEWEQILTSGAVCQNMLIAASAYGFAAQWITEWYAFDERVLKELGLRGNERVTGYIYIGVAKEDPKERARPIMKDIVTRY